MSRPAIGRGRERQVAQMRQSLAGDVAVKDLEDEQTNRRDRIENTFSPSVVNVAACLANGLFVEQLLGVVLDVCDSAGDTGHP